MGTVDERVAAVEVRVGEHAVMIEGLREAVASLDRRVVSLESRMDQRFTALETKIDQRFAETNERFGTIDQRFVAIDQRFVTMDQRFATMDQRFATIDDRFTRLEDKMFRQFVWTIGVQVTMFVMMTATLLSAILMQR